MPLRSSPVLNAEATDWRLRAACRTADPDMFFHPDNERGPSRRRRETLAKRVCRTCPVTADCLADALRRNERYGVWGGLSEHEREALSA